MQSTVQHSMDMAEPLPGLHVPEADLAEGLKAPPQQPCNEAQLSRSPKQQLAQVAHMQQYCRRCQMNPASFMWPTGVSTHAT